MLSHLRQRVVETLAPIRQVMLATYGPADIQAEEVTCAASGLKLYVLLPLTSDLLFNIESHANVAVSTAAWQLHGRACVLDATDWPRNLALPFSAEAEWQALAEICPTRLQIFTGPDGPETIDIDCSPAEG